MIGQRIIIPVGSEIRADYLRGGRGFGSPGNIPAGCYIVDGCDYEEEPTLLLAHAGWECDEDTDSRETYCSGKHIYRVKRKDLVITIDLFTALYKVEVQA